MRAVDRKSLDAPKVLTEDGKRGAKELDKARLWRADTDPKKKSFSFSVYKHAEVKAALEKLFHGKCAYCESFYSAQAPVDVEHFRPKGAVEGEADGGDERAGHDGPGHDHAARDSDDARLD